MNAGHRRAIGACLATALASFALPAAAQNGIPPGREAVVLEAVQEAFGEEPAAAITIEQATIRATTSDGATLLATRHVEVQVSVECETPCSRPLQLRWTPVAARLQRSLDTRADEIWQVPIQPRASGSAARWVERTPLSLGFLSYGCLGLLLFGVFFAPKPWPAGRRRDAVFALLVVLGFFVVAMTLGDPRPLHDHLCNLERARCAAATACEEVHLAWGRPTFHVMGVILAAVPHRLEWVLGVGVLLTAAALFLVFDVTTRVALRVGVPAQQSSEAGLWALVLAALHPGIIRVAGAGSFWPLMLLLTLLSLHLLLRASPPTTRDRSDAAPSVRTVLRRSAGLVGAGVAFALALGGNRLALVLTPMVVLAPWAWRSLAPNSRALVPAALIAVLVPLSYFMLAVQDMLDIDAYGAASGLGERATSVFDTLIGGANGPRYSSVFTIPLLGLAVCSRQRWRGLLPLVYAFVSLRAGTLRVVDPLDWETGYPDAYLKHFATLVLIAPLLGIGAFVAVRFVSARLEAPRPVHALAAVVLVAAVWAAPDARRLLFAHRVMERELVGLTEAFEVLPPHDALVFVPLAPPPEGFSHRGDPLEMHFPTRIYETTFVDRGQRPGTVLTLEALDEPWPTERRVLLYVGSTLRTFYAEEVTAGRMPDNFERPELRAIRDRYTLEPVHLFSVPTESMGGLDRPLAAGRVPAIDLGFYWLTPRVR